MGSFKVLKELKKLVYFLGEFLKVISCFKKFDENETELNRYFT